MAVELHVDFVSLLWVDSPACSLDELAFLGIEREFVVIYRGVDVGDLILQVRIQFNPLCLRMHGFYFRLLVSVFCIPFSCLQLNEPVSLLLLELPRQRDSPSLLGITKLRLLSWKVFYRRVDRLRQVRIYGFRRRLHLFAWLVLAGLVGEGC